ncbi:transcription factor, putative [Ricinus communis]|uniref:Transcription factor, putative n=1 Tax=Ricinus communis TaxID=3988 RepID=B9S6F4_RICCO|nr:transcription factor, putative [Ricinus communis]
MEVRSQDKEIGMPSSLDCNPPKRDSSSKFPPMISALGERTTDHQPAISQTHEQHHPLYDQPKMNLHQQSLKPIRDLDLIPDPAPAPAPATGATNRPPVPSSRSMSRSPPPASAITTTASAPSVRYRECLKNHAASTGGLIVDGCGEFMPSGQEGTLEAMKCAACECHRNFHRKEIHGESQCAANCYCKNNSQRNNTVPPPYHHLSHSLASAQPPIHQRRTFPHGFSSAVLTAPVLMTFGSGGAAAESSSEDLDMFQPNSQGHGCMQQLKKRYRTKFSQEQKDKMMEFAERLEWKIQKQDDQEVQQFCTRVGVKRRVFMVWMHNNKQAMKKKQM